jgi:hypothetical protein
MAERVCTVCTDNMPVVTCKACGVVEDACVECLNSDCEVCGAQFCEECRHTERFLCFDPSNVDNVIVPCANCLPGVLNRRRPHTQHDELMFCVDGDVVCSIVNRPDLVLALQGLQRRGSV